MSVAKPQIEVFPVRLAPRIAAGFISPMGFAPTERLPEGENWLFELKLNGCRAIAFKSGGKLHLRSREDTDLSAKYPAIVTGLAALPDETVIDGEIIALDQAGRPSSQALRSYGSSETPLLYYVFDVMVFDGFDLMRQSLQRRRSLLGRKSSRSSVNRCGIPRAWTRRFPT